MKADKIIGQSRNSPLGRGKVIPPLEKGARGI